MRLLPGAAKAIKTLNDLGYIVAVVTNQAVVGRGLITENELDEIHRVLTQRLSKGGAHLHWIYYCPHHPEAKIKRYRMKCHCRKPNVGMIRKAVKQFKINPKQSFLIGDTTRDILTGKRAGLTTILVKTGYGGKDGEYEIKPDFIARDLRGAVNIVGNK